MRAALFDMDRTLIRRETASMFVTHQRRVGEATWRDSARVMWWVAQYTMGVLDAQDVARRAVLSLSGMHETVLAARCDDWFRNHVEEHVCDLGRRAVEQHRAEGDVLAIVTGATRFTAGPLARRMRIPHVVASELEVDAGGRFTGQFVEPLCYGAGKIVRTERLARELGFRIEEATFYSDSFTDLPLLERVREPIVVNPDPRLARLARQRRWRIVAW
jgi:HAD superfamily hydrolase (TIGR01490 family)